MNPAPRSGAGSGGCWPWRGCYFCAGKQFTSARAHFVFFRIFSLIFSQPARAQAALSHGHDHDSPIACNRPWPLHLIIGTSVGIRTYMRICMHMVRSCMYSGRSRAPCWLQSPSRGSAGPAVGGPHDQTPTAVVISTRHPGRRPRGTLAAAGNGRAARPGGLRPRARPAAARMAMAMAVLRTPWFGSRDRHPWSACQHCRCCLSLASRHL